MYSLDIARRLKRLITSAGPGDRHVAPAVWGLGLTSMLTDISTEMVSSVLPAFLVLHLHLNPLEFGLVDGIYQGFAAMLFGLSLFTCRVRDRKLERGVALDQLLDECRLAGARRRGNDEQRSAVIHAFTQRSGSARASARSTP